MRRFPRRGLACLALLALLALASGTASAHANLVSAEPAPNSELDAAPDELVLRFSERLEDRYTRVQVTGPDSERLDQANDIDPGSRTTITVPLEPVPDGITTVRWRTLSVDTHTRSGVYILAVNESLGAGGSDPTVSPMNASEAGDDASRGGWSEALTRGMALTGAAVGVGAPAVWLVLDRSRLPDVHRRRLIHAGTIGHALAAAGTLGLAWFIGRRIEAGLTEAFSTSSGGWLAARLALHLAAGAILLTATRPRDRVLQGAGAGASLVAGIGAMAATSLSGHPGAVADAAGLVVTLDVLHQGFMALWTAGLILLLWLAWADQDDVALAPIIKRLSPWFVGSVVGLAITGSYASWVHLDRVSDLWLSDYGQALLVKIVLLVGLTGLGAYHRYQLAPRLANASQRARRAFRRSITTEVLLIGVVLVAAGALTNTAPPGPGTQQAAAADLFTDEPGDAGLDPIRSFQDGRFNVSLFITPAPVRVGFQNLTVQVALHHGEIPENAAVIVRLHPPSDPHGEGESLRLDPTGNATWSREGTIFIEEGTWHVLVAFQGKGTYVQHAFELDVQPAGSR